MAGFYVEKLNEYNPLEIMNSLSPIQTRFKDMNRKSVAASSVALPVYPSVCWGRGFSFETKAGAHFSGHLVPKPPSGGC